MAYIGRTRDYLLHLNTGEEVFRSVHELKQQMTGAEVTEHDENLTAELDRVGISSPPLLLEEKGPGVEVVLHSPGAGGWGGFTFTRGRGLRWFSIDNGPEVEVVYNHAHEH